MIDVKNPKAIWGTYEQGKGYNTAINLYETVEVNERFYAGDQWHGVDAPDLDKPVLNVITQPVNYMVATIVSDDVSISLSPSIPSPSDERFLKAVATEIGRVREQCNMQTVDREAARNAAVDGDACLYVYWDEDIKTGQKTQGDIRTQIYENTNCLFGNPVESDPQKQPYIIMVQRVYIDDAIALAVENGMSEEDAKRQIKTDESDDEVQYDGSKLVTILRYMWRDQKTKTIHMTESTSECIIREEWDTGLTLYPVAWYNWQRSRKSYHGVSVVSAVIPNQILINKLLAEKNRIVEQVAFPKIVYDRAKFPNGWDYRIGAAIAVNGLMQGMTFAEIFPPAQSSSEVTELINMLTSETLKSIGANEAAMGQMSIDNTSAIIANQEANTVPLELQRRSYYDFEEQITRIMLDILREYAGVRYVPIEDTQPAMPQMAPQMPGAMPGTMPGAGLPQKLTSPVVDSAVLIGTATDPALAPDGTMAVDFGKLGEIAYNLKVDVGAGSYYSEIVRLKTLDNMLAQHIITPEEHVERMPSKYIADKERLLESIKARSGMAPGEIPANPMQPGAEIEMSRPIATAKNYINGLRQGL